MKLVVAYSRKKLYNIGHKCLSFCTPTVACIFKRILFSWQMEIDHALTGWLIAQAQSCMSMSQQDYISLVSATDVILQRVVQFRRQGRETW